MSHAHGKVVFEDKHVLYYEYDGTVDRVCPKLWDTVEDVSKNWREPEPFSRTCTCGKDEPVVIDSDYGFGFHWNGRACRTCKVITQGLEPYSYDNGLAEV